MIDSISELFVYQRRIFMIFLFDEKYRKHIKIKKHEIKFHAQSYLHLKSSLQLPQLKVQTYHFSVHVVVDKTSRKWLTVAIFWKWQDSSVALWIDIAVMDDFRGWL